MIGCLRTRVRKQLIIALYFESETVLKVYNLKAWWIWYFKMLSAANLRWILNVYIFVYTWGENLQNLFHVYNNINLLLRLFK